MEGVRQQFPRRFVGQFVALNTRVCSPQASSPVAAARDSIPRCVAAGIGPVSGAR
jgi:hypothetical protein